MFALTPEQEQKIQRQDRRIWQELVARQWYASGYPGAEDYPADALLSHLCAVYHACQRAGLESLEHISLLGFNVLRANSQGFDDDSVADMVDFFIGHARGDNIDYAQNWVELQLEGEA